MRLIQQLKSPSLLTLSVNLPLALYYPRLLLQIYRQSHLLLSPVLLLPSLLLQPAYFQAPLRAPQHLPLPPLELQYTAKTPHCQPLSTQAAVWYRIIPASAVFSGPVVHSGTGVASRTHTVVRGVNLVMELVDNLRL
jgi:hypothetical protein